MRSKPLAFSPPALGEDEIAEVVKTLRSGWITTGPRTAQFEKQFAAAVHAPAALGLNSGSAALHLALVTLGIGPGDAVITTPMTFCATAHAIEHTGARPVFVDVERDTLNINPGEIRKVLEGPDRARVKAILPVHLYGHPCDLDAILKIASDSRLAIVEDAAHALPASFRGRPVGSPTYTAAVPILTCFSFYATKNLTTAEGGMLTGPPALIEQARIWSLHGINRDAWRRGNQPAPWQYDVDRAGFKYNMSDLQAALGLPQLAKLASSRSRRAEIAARYSRAFRESGHFQTPVERNNVEHAWHLYVLRLNLDRCSISRDQFIEELAARGIPAGVHFIPLHFLTFYRDKYGFRAEDFPVASNQYQRILSLPIYPQMTDEDVRDVIAAVTEVAALHAAPAGCAHV